MPEPSEFAEFDGPPAVARGSGEGRPFGPYRLLDVLGTGPWSAVYRAIDTRTGHALALKVWSATRSGPGRRARALAASNRAQRMQQLTNVPVHEVGEADGVPYLAYQAILAASVADVLETHGPLDAETALGVVNAAATLLEHAHAHAEWHGKVSPSNILVDDTDLTRAHLYLVDFAVPPDEVLDHDPYSAPEFNAGRPHDARADVFSLAATYFTCLTGIAPFGATWIDGEFHPWHEGASARRLRELRPDLPPAVDEVLADALHARVDRRPRSVTQLVQQIMDAWSAPARDADTVEDDVADEPRFQFSRRMLVGAGVAVAVAVLLGAGVAMFKRTTAPEPARPTTTTVDPTAASVGRLRALAPDGARCVPSDERRRDEVGHVVCETTKGTLTLREFASREAMANAFSGRREAVQIPQSTKAPEPDSPCTGSAEIKWTDRDAAVAGTYLCDAPKKRVDFTGNNTYVWGYLENEDSSVENMSKWFLDTLKPRLEQAPTPPTTTSEPPVRKR